MTPIVHKIAGIPHDDGCGICEYRRIMEKYGWTQAVRTQDVGTLCTREEIYAIEKKIEAEWQQTKYYAFYADCKAKGLDSLVEAKKIGWEL